METTYPQDNRVAEYVAAAMEAGEMTCDDGTRLYRVRQHWLHLQTWVHSLQEAFDGEVLPFEWVPDYVRVTRAAVHKRVKKGQLTVFAFEAMDEFAPVGGIQRRSKMRSEYRYVPRTECDVWLLNSLGSTTERSDIRMLRTPHIPGWWNDMEMD